MNKLMVQVVDNFSHERIEHLQKVVQYLRPVSKNDTKTHSSDKKNNINNHSKNDMSYKEQGKRDKEAGIYRRAKMAAAAGVAVMSITKAIVEITASTAVATIVGGAVIGMVAGSAIEKIKA